MDKIKVFKIDVAQQQLIQIEVNPMNIGDFYEAIGNNCNMIENVSINLPDGDTMLVDEDGRYKDGHAGVFIVKGRSETFLGNGIIVGTKDGEFATPKIKQYDMAVRIMYGHY